jgi:hypothetical protein
MDPRPPKKSRVNPYGDGWGSQRNKVKEEEEWEKEKEKEKAPWRSLASLNTEKEKEKEDSSAAAPWAKAPPSFAPPLPAWAVSEKDQEKEQKKMEAELTKKFREGGWVCEEVREKDQEKEKEKKQKKKQEKEHEKLQYGPKNHPSDFEPDTSDEEEKDEEKIQKWLQEKEKEKDQEEETIDLTDEPGADTQEAMDMSEASANSLVSAEQDETGRSQFEEVQERAIKRGVVLLPYRTPPTQTQEGVKRTLLREPSIDGNGDSAAGLPAAGEDAGPINAATGGSLASSSTTPLMEVLESQEVEEVLESQELQEAQF